MNTSSFIKDMKKYPGYLLSGFLIGLAISLFIAITILSKSDYAMSISGYHLLHLEYPFVILIDILPFLLAILNYTAARFYFEKTNQLNSLIGNEKNQREKLSIFIESLSKGNLEVDYELNENNDDLGYSILELRNHLVQNRIEEEKRRKEDAQRNWITEGLAKFAEILRQNNDNLNELSYFIISNLVKYMGINQGGFYILKDDEGAKYFEQNACYAYDRKKFSEKRIEWGEGLIGACALEKESIFMTDVPNKYTTITSGLGDATPGCIFIVPLKMNNEVQGVIELASFKVLEPFETQFVEKLADSIASTLYSVKSNIKTQMLLEQSQRQADELSQQEEELRQNLEELRVTQEQIAVQSKEFEIFTHAVNHTMIRAEFDAEGTLTFANEKFISKLSYANSGEVMNKHVSSFINPKDQEAFFSIWDNIFATQNNFEGELKYMNKHGKDIWTMTTILCVTGELNNIDKIIFLAIDINEQKEQNLDYEAQIHALDRSSLKAQFTPDGMMASCNDVFCEILGYESHEELEKKSIFDLINKEDFENFKTIWSSALTGEPFKGQLKKITKTKEEKWFQCTLTSVLNMYSEVVKIIYIATDITEQKKMEIATKEQAELLRLQEEKLRQSQEELSIKLEEVRNEMMQQFKEIEKIKIRNERTLEGAHDAIITIDKSGKIEFFNKAAESLWGYNRDEIMGKNVGLLFPEALKTSDEMVASLLNGTEKIVGVRKELKVLSKDGEEKSVLLLLSEAKINDEHTYTAFIQNIEVELF